MRRDIDAAFACRRKHDRKIRFCLIMPCVATIYSIDRLAEACIRAYCDLILTKKEVLRRGSGKSGSRGINNFETVTS